MQAVNVVGERIEQLEKGARAFVKDADSFPIQYVQEFIRKNAIAYHPYISFWGNDEDYISKTKGETKKSHLFGDPSETPYYYYYQCYLSQQGMSSLSCEQCGCDRHLSANVGQML